MALVNALLDGTGMTVATKAVSNKTRIMNTTKVVAGLHTRATNCEEEVRGEVVVVGGQREVTETAGAHWVLGVSSACL